MELEEECNRLRGQLSLAQQQMAKAATRLAARKDVTVSPRSSGDSFVQPAKTKRHSETPTRSWGKSKRKTDDDAAAPSEPQADGEDMAAKLLVQTTAQLDSERSRAAMLEKELEMMRANVETKIDERLNEMARRLNKANQGNEIRYKNMVLETEDSKQQVMSCRKAYLRKAADLEGDIKERLKASDEKIIKAVEFAKSLREECQKARVLQSEVDQRKHDLDETRKLTRRSVEAISMLKQEAETSGKEIVNLREKLAEAESAIQEGKAKITEGEAKVTELEDQILQLQAAQEKERSKNVEDVKVLQAKHESMMLKVEQTLVNHPRLQRTATGSGTIGPTAKFSPMVDKQHLKKKKNSVQPSSTPSMSLQRAKNSSDDSNLSLLDMIETRQNRSPSLAEALGESPQLRRRSDTDLPCLVIDDTWKSWITAPYIYDKWDTIRNDDPPVAFARPEPLVTKVRGHQFETGMKFVPLLGDESHAIFVEPLERVPYYQQTLQTREHVHFIGSSTTGEHMVVTLEAATDDNRRSPLLSLVHMKKSTKRAAFIMEKIDPLPGNILELDPFLGMTYPGCSLKRVDDPAAHDLVSQRLVEFENMHLDFNRRVGILYWKAGQNENEAFGNHMSPELDEFLDFFGERIQLKGWQKFRGGLNVTMDETGEYSVYAEYKEFNFMAHVSALLPFREEDDQKLDRKRHIGNDLVVIIFWEGPGSFDASQLVTQMCHVFIVIEKVPSLSAEDGQGSSALPRYRVAVVCRSGVQPFAPFLPLPGVFDADDSFRDWLFMKLINGERATFQAKTFLTKTITARKVLLDKLWGEAMEEMVDPPEFSPPLLFSRMVAREPLIRVKATSLFAGVTSAQLSFKKGEEIVVYCKLSAEWWNGGIGNRRGDFPCTKVALVEKKERRKRGLTRPKLESAVSKQQLTPSSPTQVEETHEIHFTLAKATGLTAKAGSNSADPIASCWIVSVNGPLEGSDRKTAKAKQTLNPEWNDGFTVKILDPLWEVLRIEVYDSEVGNPAFFMGATEIPCGQMLGKVGEGVWEAPLEASNETKTSDAIVTGTVSLSVTKVTAFDVAAGRRGLVQSMGELTLK